MNQERVAKALFSGLKKHGIESTFEHLAFDELPKGFTDQLLDIAGTIPQENPMAIMVRFRAWAVHCGHYPIHEAVDRFLEMESSNG